MSTVFNGEGRMSTVVHRLQFSAAGVNVHSCPQITVFRGEGTITLFFQSVTPDELQVD